MINFADDDQAQVLWLVHITVKFANAIYSQFPERLHHSESFVSKPNAFWVEHTLRLLKDKLL